MLPRAIIIDGPILLLIMKDTSIINNEILSKKSIDEMTCKEMFLQLCLYCQTVIGCRVSPDQKREMVSFIKTSIKDVRTLAIGDGANDVAMIQEAHLGVGISGEEGLQAVNSSDIAIGQFCYLKVLLLKHGRRNYIRMCNLICYMFYKNILMSIAQFWINFVNAFSGQVSHSCIN